METMLFSIFFTLGLGCALGYFTFLLHKTEMLRYYAEALKIDKLLGIEEYLKWNENHTGEYQYYPAYISYTKAGFWAHLFGCPFCSMAFLLFWSGVAASIALISLWPLFLAFVASFIAALAYLTIAILHKKME